MRPRSQISLLMLLASTAGGCSQNSPALHDFVSSVIVQGTVRDTLGVPLPGVAVATVGFSAGNCSGYTWSTDSTATDTLGRYSCLLFNLGRPQSVSATARPAAGLGLMVESSCRVDLHLEAPAWRDTVTVDFVLRGD